MVKTFRQKVLSGRLFHVGFDYMGRNNYKVIKSDTTYHAVKKYVPKGYKIQFCSKDVNSLKSVYIVTSPNYKIQKQINVFEIIENL